jgi:hypothetical protein
MQLRQQQGPAPQKLRINRHHQAIAATKADSLDSDSSLDVGGTGGASHQTSSSQAPPATALARRSLIFNDPIMPVAGQSDTCMLADQERDQGEGGGRGSKPVATGLGTRHQTMMSAGPSSMHGTAHLSGYLTISVRHGSSEKPARSGGLVHSGQASPRTKPQNACASSGHHQDLGNAAEDHRYSCEPAAMNRDMIHLANRP